MVLLLVPPGAPDTTAMAATPVRRGQTTIHVADGEQTSAAPAVAAAEPGGTGTTYGANASGV